MTREHRAVSHKGKKISTKKERIALTPRDKAVMRELGNSRFETAGGLDYDDEKLPPMAIRVARGVPGKAANPVDDDRDFEVIFHTHPQTLKKFDSKSREYRIWVKFQTFFSTGDLNKIIHWSFKKYRRTNEYVVGPAGDIYESQIFDPIKLRKWMRKDGDIIKKLERIETDAFIAWLDSQNLRWRDSSRAHDIIIKLTTIVSDDPFVLGDLKTDLKITAKEEKAIMAYIDAEQVATKNWLKTIGIKLRLLPKDTVSYLDISIKHSRKNENESQRKLQREFRKRNKTE
ncbi:hypothetical protein LCGC14_0303060 [marine sediment metagenome]|uniref:Uncharacterized protein n=1 Tax=marine sediment metagenome TaxID=412755 RepID=A0A0F9TPP5_9ZZZZ